MPISIIRETVLKLLAQREHSRFELRSKLQQRDFSTEDIENIIIELTNEDWQSDQRFAESYIRSRYEKGYGPLYIQRQLEQHQLEETDILALLDQYDWVALAEKVRIKKFTVALPKTLTMRAKQMRFLQYRGFTDEQIKATLLAQ